MSSCHCQLFLGAAISTPSTLLPWLYGCGGGGLWERSTLGPTTPVTSLVATLAEHHTLRMINHFRQFSSQMFDTFANYEIKGYIKALMLSKALALLRKVLNGFMKNMALHSLCL